MEDIVKRLMRRIAVLEYTVAQLRHRVEKN